jgi:hypothetical protein
VHLRIPGRAWSVAGRFATVPLRSCRLPLERLGLDPAGRYHVMDFWTQRYRGIVTGAIRCGKLPLGHCQVLGFTPAADHPQLIGSTRHVSMDAVSVADQKWRDGELVLGLRGVAGTTETYSFHVPAGFELVESVGQGLTARCRTRGELLKAAVRFESADGRLALRFARRGS